MTTVDAHDLMLDAIHAAMKEGPTDTDRFYYRMGALVLDGLRHTAIIRDIYLTGSGAWYLCGHRIEVDYDNPDAPVTVEVTK